MDNVRGLGRAIFAAVLLMIGGVLNIIYGIAAISNSHFFNGHTNYVFGSLHTWGWIVLLLGVAQVLVAWGIWTRNQFARWTGVVVLSLNAIANLLMIPGYYDVALRDLGLALGALSLGRLSQEYAD